MTDDASGSSVARPVRLGLVLPWGWLSVGLAVVAISSLGTLAVVTNSKEADALSTIALALAILAFAAQLIVSLADAFTGAQQLAQVERVNADTQSALSEIRATSNALLSNQRENFSEVLRAALRSAVPAAVEDVAEESRDESPDGDSGFDGPLHSLEERLITRLDAALLTARNAGTAETRTFLRSESGERRAQELRVFPAQEEAMHLVTLMRSLNSWEAAFLSRLVYQYFENLRQGRTSPFRVISRRVEGVRNPVREGLRDKGLIEMKVLDHRSDATYERVQLTFTSLGLALAPFCLQISLPDWLRAEMAQDAST